MVPSGTTSTTSKPASLTHSVDPFDALLASLPAGERARLEACRRRATDEAQSTNKVCFFNISVYIQSMFSLCSVYVQSMFSLCSV